VAQGDPVSQTGFNPFPDIVYSDYPIFRPFPK